MILYVNGDSHSAGAEAVNSHCFADDDPKYRHLGRIPHPDNLLASYGSILANNLNATLYCDAESGASNDRIIRTTYNYLSNHPKPLAIVIGWATWDREEFLTHGIPYQISVGSFDNSWPSEVKEYHRNWVNHSSPFKKEKYWHDRIYEMHMDLDARAIPHLFFNTYLSFNHNTITKYEWNNAYIDPYSDAGTYYTWAKAQGHDTATPDTHHFKADAHLAWGNHLTNTINESIITT